MKRINTIDLYVDGNDPSTGVVITGDQNVIVKAVLVDNADADTLQVVMPHGDEAGNFRGSAHVVGLTAPVSPEIWEVARQAWIDEYGTEPTEDELLVVLSDAIEGLGIGVEPVGVLLQSLAVDGGSITPGKTVMFPISGYAQVYAGIFANANPNSKSTRVGYGATRAKATLTFISE